MLEIKVSFFVQSQLIQSLLTRRIAFVANFSSYSCFLAKDGVVIASEKKLHPLVIGETVHKIANVTDNIGMVYSGIGPDFRVLVRKARKKAQEYYRYYKEQISVNRLVREVAAIMQEYTQSGYEGYFRLSSSLPLCPPLCGSLRHLP